MKFVRNPIRADSAGARLLRNAMFLLTASIAGLSAFAHADWSWQNPQPTSYELWAVALADANNGIFVGEGGLMMATSDGGATWTPRDSGVTVDGTLYRVHYVDANTVVSAGAYVFLTGEASGVVTRSIDGGASWSVLGNPVPNILFADAYFTDADNGIAVGGNFSTFVPTISQTNDGGATWDTQTLDGILGYLLAVSFPNPDTGFAVGYDFALSQAVVVNTTDGGTTWQTQSINSDQVLNDVKFSDAGHGVAVGNAGALFVTSDGGATWDARDAGTTLDLHGIGYIGTDAILVTGGDYADQGILLTSTDGGATWSNQSFDRSLNYVSFANAETGTAVGSRGELLRTVDGGQTWTPQQQSVSQQGLFGMAFSSTSAGSAVGSAGTIVRTTDGGQHWLLQTSGTDLVLYGVAAASDNDLIAVGGDTGTFAPVILGTTDGGATWNNITPTDLIAPLLSVSCPAVGTCTAVGSCGTIVRTEDGGTTWTTQIATDCSAQVDLQSVYFRDANTGIAVGIDTILQTTDGGATWTYQQPPTDQLLHAVTFADAENGYIAGGHQQDRGTILHTTDGGATWSAQREDLPTPVQAIAFSDANDGIVVTLGGEIYRTHDSGATWSLDTRVIANLYGVVHKDNASAITVGFSNYNAAILGWTDRLFANGFD